MVGGSEGGGAGGVVESIGLVCLVVGVGQGVWLRALD